MALKTKYTGEKEKKEKEIYDLSQYIKAFEQENNIITQEIDLTNKNYYDLNDKFTRTSDFFREKIMELREKIINEDNTKELDLLEQDLLDKTLFKFTSSNTFHGRTIEKKRLFKENIEEKHKILKDKANDKLNNIDKVVVKSLIEYEVSNEKFEANEQLKFVEQENTEIIFTLNK
jgi:hypothetical protein